MYISEEWMNFNSGKTISKINPANPEEVIGEFQQGNFEDMNRAVDAAECFHNSNVNLTGASIG